MTVTFDEGSVDRPHVGASDDHASAPDRVEYRSWMSDNLRWDALEMREGDIVISTPPKCGTTWTQRLISLLIFDGPELPAPMSLVSPWLDLTVEPIEEVVACLGAQKHRRFIKTHTPLDGLVLDDRVTYIVVGRDPRDAAVSMLRDRDRIRALHEVTVPPHDRFGPPRRHSEGRSTPGAHERIGPRRRQLEGENPPGHRDGYGPPPRRDGGGAPPPPPGRFGPGHPHPVRPPGQSGPPDSGLDMDRSPLDVMRDWIERPIMPPEGVVSLATILHHFSSAWDRRHLPNVAAFHYADYKAGVVGELVRLGEVLDISVSPRRAEELAQHATLEAMRARDSELSPDLWQSTESVFRAGGRGGAWRDIFTEAEHRRYSERAAQLTSPGLFAWAHEGRRGCDPDL